MSSENSRTWNDDEDDDEEDEDIREFNEELRRSSPRQNVLIYKREESIKKRPEGLSNEDKMADSQQNQRRDHHRHHNRKMVKDGGHVKEFIKPDPTVRRQAIHKNVRPTGENEPSDETSNQEAYKTTQPLRVVTVVDEEQLHKRLVESSSKNKRDKFAIRQTSSPNQARPKSPDNNNDRSERSLKSVSDSASTSSSNGIDRQKSPLPAKILIPPEVAKSLSKRNRELSIEPVADNQGKGSQSHSSVSGKSSSGASQDPPAKITKEQLEYGPFLKHDEVQVLYRSPEAADNALGVLRSSCYCHLLFMYLARSFLSHSSASCDDIATYHETDLQQDRILSLT